MKIVDGENEPEFKNLKTSEIKNYLRDKYQGREVTIKSDGTIVLFTRNVLNLLSRKEEPTEGRCTVSTN